jgi:hypothetical protein
MLSFSFLLALLNGVVDSRQPFPFIGLTSRLFRRNVLDSAI